MSAAQPLVSVVLTTRDRPTFLRIALRCYQHQTYPSRELIVVDDGDRFPASEAAVRAAGGRLLRVPPGTLLGEKLNIGCAEARGVFLQKMDDDDWYGQHFLEAMVRRILMEWQVACSPALAFIQPILFFSLGTWEIRRSSPRESAGGTLCFPRSLWQERPFRHLSLQEDFWFLMDAHRLGARWLPVRDDRAYLNVRHNSRLDHQQHLWTRQWDTSPMEEHVRRLESAEIEPDTILPPWALAEYRAIHDQILAAEASPEPRS